MEIVSSQKYINSAPRKLRLLAEMVRKMSPQQALETLRFTPKAAAKDLEKAVKVALANAKQAGLDDLGLIFAKIEVNEGAKMRRFRAGTRGRVKPYKKRMSHIKIVLSDNQVKSVKKEEGKEAEVKRGTKNSSSRI